MLKNLDWQEEIDGRKDFDCVISADGSLTTNALYDLETIAWRTFSSVELCVYPEAPNSTWPFGPNWAFQHTAKYMERGGRPWFWMEPDCVALKSGWLNFLNQTYFRSRKPIMGVIIEGMGHCNGTAIYPANFPRLSPNSMRCTHLAWDGVMKDETIQHTADGKPMMCHVWGIENGKALAFGGSPAHFTSWEDVMRWVDPRAMVFHRAKDGSLIDQLRLKRNEGRNIPGNIRAGCALA
jgi:hypothetical protein